MFEDEIRRHHELQKANILRGFGTNFESEEDLEFAKGEVEYDDELEKAVYADTAENRKLGRVGQEYHRGKGKKQEEPTQKVKKQGNSGSFSLINPRTGKPNRNNPKVRRLEALWDAINGHQFWDESTNGHRWARNDEKKSFEEEYNKLSKELKEEQERWNNNPPSEGIKAHKKAEEKKKIEEEKRKKRQENIDKYKERINKQYEDSKKREETLRNSDPEFHKYAKNELSSLATGLNSAFDDYTSHKDIHGNQDEYFKHYYSNGDGKGDVADVKAAIKKFGEAKVKKYVRNLFKDEFGSNGAKYCKHLLAAASK